MAYTYEDFSKRAQEEGLLAQFSPQELATAQKSPEYGLALLSVKKDLAGATTQEQRMLATAAADQLRQAYGVSNTPTQSQGGFVYSREDDYKKLFDSLTDPDGFSYDYSTDPAFSAYKKARLREADRSMKDTLAAVSGATGGVPSSYAVTAAQQARDYEASKIGDIIPELYEAAYGRQQDALSILAEDRENAYAQYLQAQAAAEAAKRAELAAMQQQVTGPVDRVTDIVKDAVQDIAQSVTDPGRRSANDALRQLLDAADPYNAAVGAKIKTDNRLNALRSMDVGGPGSDGEPVVDTAVYEDIRAAAFEAAAAGRGQDLIVKIIWDAEAAGDLTHEQAMDIIGQLQELWGG